MAFQEFTQKKSRSSKNSITISISGGCRIGISKTAYDTYFKGIKHVVLAFDSETNKIGLKPVKEQSEISYPLMIPKGRNTGIYIVAKSFFDYFKIGKEKKICRDITKSGDFVVIDLAENQESNRNKG